MISELRDFLARERVPFSVSDPAAASPASGRPAHVVLLRDRDSYAVAVLPTGTAFDLTAFRRRTGRYAVTLAEDDELRRAFPELGDGPLLPFGRLFAIPVYLDRALAFETAMTFESGAPREVIGMPMSEYVRVERPAIVSITEALRAA
jgi:Ala-tRNA(Pro) deacylase